MSVEAMSWALRQPVSHSSAKFVLVVLADCADKETGLAWPSMAHLCEATSQDRKTVIANIARLKSAGYIEDAGERKGATKQVVVYRLKSPESGTVSQSNGGQIATANGTGNGIVSGEQIATQDTLNSANSTENGTDKESQKRDSLQIERVPKTDTNSTVFPVKQSRFSAKESQKRDTEPSEPSRNHQEPRAVRATRLPADWVLTDAYREAAKAVCPHWPTGHVERVADSFRDYWVSRPGSGGTKLDWLATWRNWCRSDRSLPANSPGKPKPGRHDLRGMDYNAGVDAHGNF